VKRKILDIPNVNGYQTLKCDFHIHTVFSDGKVWPDVRVQEAWKEGLDVIAITDHVEYQPHSENVRHDHNRSYQLAKEAAKEKNLLVIKGTEISRQTPPGHFNAIFVGDASQYIEDNDSDKDREAILKPAQQDAFIFWNHPGWKPATNSNSYEWIDFVDRLYEEDILMGIEVFNGFDFFKKSLDWCVDNGLTVMATSDIHNLVEHDYNLYGPVHRTMTLVFAKEKTTASVRDALEAGRTVAWASKYLAGKEEHVRDLFHASVEMGRPYHSENTTDNNAGTKYYEIQNTSDLYFEMELKSGRATEKITLYPHSSQVIKARGGQQKLTYEVVTAFIRSDEHLVVDIALD
jgi:hypothetical protein